MTSRLVEEGWIAPEHPGPLRRTAVMLALVAVAAIAGWAVWLLVVASPSNGPRRTVTLDIAELAKEAEVRTTGATRFVVLRRTLAAGNRYRVTTTSLPGLDPRAISVRVLSDGARVLTITGDEAPPVVDVDPRRGQKVRLLVVVPADGLSTAAPAGRLSDVTRPVDEAREDAVATYRRVSTLRGWLPWLVVLGPLLAVGLPLLLWRRARRSTFNLRVPGPGKELGGEPPSSLDPVGVAVLAAGAADVNEGDAFAGHVLDLVERRQVRMRRMESSGEGPGVVLGLANVEEGAIADDPAVTLLRSLADADGDGVTVTLPEATSARRSAVPAQRVAWGSHVAQRARFERMTIDGNAGRVRLATEVLGTVGVLAVIEALRTSSDGRAALAWLVAAVALPATFACIAWARDARSWRVVARGRRVERAQWRAWRESLGASDGPELDQRSLPLFVAAGGRGELVRAVADPGAVALDAATQSTIGMLRAVVGSEQPT